MAIPDSSSNLPDNLEEQTLIAHVDEPPPKRARVAAPPEIQKLMGLICNLDALKAAVRDVGYDLDRTPLEQLERNTLREAFTWLKAIESELGKPTPNERSLTILSSSFFNLLPLVVSVDQTNIDSRDKMKEKLRILQLLSDVEAVYLRLEKLDAGGGFRKFEDDELEQYLDEEGIEASIKRPQTPYFLWLAEQRAAITQEIRDKTKDAGLSVEATSSGPPPDGPPGAALDNPVASAPVAVAPPPPLGESVKVYEVARRGGEIWKELSDAQRAPYEERYRAAKEDWDEEQNAIKAKRRAAAEEVDPLPMRQLRALGCKLSQELPGSNAWRLAYDYARSVSGPLAGMTLRVRNVFDVDRQSEERAFKRHSKAAGRLLLWQAAPPVNWPALLSMGPRPPPAEAPVVGGGMWNFGRGIYFYDSPYVAAARADLPAPASASQAAHGPVLLLLAEVAMGRSKELTHPQPTAERLPTGCHSIIGRGRRGPNEQRMRTAVTVGGAMIPFGPHADRPLPKGTAPVPANAAALPCNEYVVYNQAQVRMRYVVEAFWVDSAEAARLDSAAVAATVKIPRRLRSKTAAPWEQVRSAPSVEKAA